jgi:CTP synthase N-terminus
MKYVLVSGGKIPVAGKLFLTLDRCDQVYLNLQKVVRHETDKCSGIGKGIIASSTGLLLRSLGLSTTYIKIDPYMNVEQVEA